MSTSQRSKRVVISGVGALSSLGTTVEGQWEKALSAHSGIASIDSFDPAQFKLQTRIAGEVRAFDLTKWNPSVSEHKYDRAAQFAIASSTDAVQSAGLFATDVDTSRVAVLIGSAMGGIQTQTEATCTLDQLGARRVSPWTLPKSMSSGLAAAVSMVHGFNGPVMAINSACASATDAIGLAADMIRNGRVDVALAGGSEAAVTPMMIAALDRMKALASTFNQRPAEASRPFDEARSGFVIAEGSALLVLESERHCYARGATPIAEIAGYGTTADAYHPTAPAPDGRGAIASMRSALLQADARSDEVVHINAHGTSTRMNDEVEAMAITELLGDRTPRVPVSATKSVTGHMGGATGAIEAVFAALSCQQGLAPATCNFECTDFDYPIDVVSSTAREISAGVVLTNSFGFGGHCASLALRPV